MMHFLLFLSQIFLLTKYLLLLRIFGPLGLVIGSRKIIPEHMEHVTNSQHCWYFSMILAGENVFLINKCCWWTNYEGKYLDKIGITSWAGSATLGDTSWARIATKLTSLAALESNSKSSWPSLRWWVTVLGKVITILWMVVSFTLLVGDHHGDGVRPYPWHSGWPFRWWWAAFLMLVGDRLLDGGGPSWEWLVTIPWKMGDHLLEGWWSYSLCWVTILRMECDHPGDGRWPFIAVVTLC